MYHTKNSITLSSVSRVLLFLIFLFPNAIIASIDNKTPSHSVITLPIQADLKALEDYVNDSVPNMITEINEPDKTCVKAQYLKTKGIPKCRMDGYKISCKDRMIKIRTLPEIKCDIKGWVKRNGRITVSGEDQTLKFAFPIKAKVSTDMGIRETANAAAVFYIYATPNIHKDWSVSVDLNPHFVWSKRPTITLLNKIKIDIQNKVEPQLRNKMKNFVKEVPDLLADLKMKEKVNTVWKEIQEPLKINDKSETYLVFKPLSASYSGFKVVDNVLHTTISTEGQTEVIMGKPGKDHKKTKLCDLQSIDCEAEGKFNFNLPVSVTYQELLNMSSRNHLNTYSIDLMKYAIPGMMDITKPIIEKTSDGKISITAQINYDNRSKWLKMIDVFNWFDVEGKITFKGSPKIDQETKCLILENLVYDSTTNNELFDLLINTTELKPLQSYFANLIKFEFGEKIDDGIAKANKAFERYSKNDVNVSTQLQVASIENVVLNDKHITFNTKLSGKVNASIGL